MKNFSDQLSKLPQKPGVYLMKDKQGTIIYIGKAKNLKNRVTSYFRGFNSHAPKTQTLVVNIDEFEYILTDTEVEALILEANLIKKHKPRFNIRLKDDKQYPYIKITKEDYPRVIKVRDVVKDQAKYYGPFTSDYDVNQTIDVIQKVFPIRQCNRDMTKKNQRPCLNYHIKQCMGPCKGNVYKEDYNKHIEDIKVFLSGKETELIEAIENQMKAAAKDLNFEKAAELRNQLKSLKQLTVKQKVTQTVGTDQDVISVAKADDKACVMIFFVRNGILLGREHFMVDDVQFDDDAAILEQFILQFYGGTAYIPKEMLLKAPIEGPQVYEEWLSKKAGKRLYITVPKIGEKKHLVDMVTQNAKEYLEKHYEVAKAKELARLRVLTELKDFINLPHLPMRLEAYDISNTMGVFSVGSMVVYEKGQKKKSDYRRFKVKTIEGPNDYGSMMEVLYRRFKRGLEEQAKDDKVSNKFDKMPNGLLIDGGKGHVHAVQEVLDAMQVDIPVIGMVKNDKHRTHALYYKGKTYILDKHSEIFVMIAGIQEEVHRFAISYHRSLRDKAMSQSVLDDIEGVGPKRKTNLLTHFKTIEKIKNASLEDLCQVPGITEGVAANIQAFFKGGTLDEAEKRES